jgi:hypothetical protein
MLTLTVKVCHPWLQGTEDKILSVTSLVPLAPPTGPFLCPISFTSALMGVLLFLFWIPSVREDVIFV